MKVLTGITLLLLAASLQTTAQEKRDTIHFKPTTDKKIKLRDELGLSKKQAKELKSSNKDFKEKAQQIKSDTTINRQERRQMMKSLLKERSAKVDSVLTPEQREKAKALRKERRAGKKDGTEQ